MGKEIKRVKVGSQGMIEVKVTENTRLLVSPWVMGGLVMTTKDNNPRLHRIRKHLLTAVEAMEKEMKRLR